MTRRPTTGPRSPRGYRGSRSFGAPASRPDGAPGCPPPVTAPGCRSARLEGHYVLRSRALLALHHVELDLGALAKRVTLALDGAVMTEDVLAAVVTGDEAEALVVGEPLDRSCRTHCRTPLVVESPECDAAFVCLMRNFRATRLRGNPSRSGGSPKVGGPFGGPSNERLQLRFADPVRVVSDPARACQVGPAIVPDATTPRRPAAGGGGAGAPSARAPPVEAGRARACRDRSSAAPRAGVSPRSPSPWRRVAPPPPAPRTC